MNDTFAELYTKEHFVELVEALHHDQTGLLKALRNVKSLINSWSWVIEGRGSYEWDDANYQKEFEYCIERVTGEIDTVINRRKHRGHALCCDRYRHLNSLSKDSVQLSFPFEQSYEEHRDILLKASTIS
jgi:hypothetical protein